MWLVDWLWAHPVTFGALVIGWNILLGRWCVRRDAVTRDQLPRVLDWADREAAKEIDAMGLYGLPLAPTEPQVGGFIEVNIEPRDLRRLAPVEAAYDWREDASGLADRLAAQGNMTFDTAYRVRQMLFAAHDERADGGEQGSEQARAGNRQQNPQCVGRDIWRAPLNGDCAPRADGRPDDAVDVLGWGHVRK